MLYIYAVLGALLPSAISLNPLDIFPPPSAPCMADPLTVSTGGNSYGDFSMASWLGLHATAGKANTFAEALRDAPVNDGDLTLEAMSPDERDMLIVVSRLLTPKN